jgi:hypothetical protein
LATDEEKTLEDLDLGGENIEDWSTDEGSESDKNHDDDDGAPKDAEDAEKKICEKLLKQGARADRKREERKRKMAIRRREFLEAKKKSLSEKGLLKKRKKKLKFYLHDPQPEVSVRHLLFAKILNDKTLAPRDRAELFLTFFGNSCVRSRDAKYLDGCVKEMVRGEVR